MTDKKWEKYQELVLTSLDKLEDRMGKLEDRGITIEKCISRLAAENKITMAILIIFLGGLITMAFSMMT